MRWFLRDGWGARAHYGTREIVMHEPEAALLLPVFEPEDVEVRLQVMAPVAGPLALAVNGQPVGAWMADASAAEQVFTIPARTLVRGDNLVTLSSPEGRPGARLRLATFVKRPGV